MKDQVSDAGLRQGLDQITAALASANRARADQAQAALVAQMEAATVLAQNVWGLENTARLQERLAGLFPPDQAQAGRAAAARRRADQQGSLDGYARLERGIAAGPAHDGIAAAADVLRQELQERGPGYLTSFLAILTRQSTALAAGQPTSRDQMLAQILAVPNEAARTQ